MASPSSAAFERPAPHFAFVLSLSSFRFRHGDASSAQCLAQGGSLADALGPRGIRVNALCRGVIDTGFAPPLPEVIADFDALAQRTQLRRRGRPEEVAAEVAWRGCDLASFVASTSTFVDGGLTADIRITSPHRKLP